MPLVDRISDLVHKIAPPTSGPKQGATLAGGIGNGHGMVPFDDNVRSVDLRSLNLVLPILVGLFGAPMVDESKSIALVLVIPALWVPWIWMIVSKPVIVAHSTQIFFNFLAMACFASVAAFQAKWDVGPSGLSGFAIFVSVAGMLLSAFMLLVPVAYEKYDKFVQLARLLKEVRVSFILTGTGTTLNLLIAFITIISSFTQPGCKDPETDPSAEEKGDDFKAALPGWCNTKKAGSFFFLFAFLAWAASLTLLILAWRSGKLSPHRDPPFNRPAMQQASEDLDEEEEGFTHIALPIHTDNSRYEEPSGHVPNPFLDGHRYSTPTQHSAVPAGRQSMDAYGAFSDPAPSGFGNQYGGSEDRYSQQQSYTPPPRAAAAPPILPEPDLGPRVSRTMQYADPYAVVRASIAGPQGGNALLATTPPSYDNYGGGYRQ